MDNLTNRRLDYYYKTEGYKATLEGRNEIISRDTDTKQSTSEDQNG